MTQQLALVVAGEPAPQGSKRIINNRLVEASSSKLNKWRKAIEVACKEASPEILEGPVSVHITFYLTRPKTVKRSARLYPIVPPDLDKLCRGVLDGVGQSGVVWGDDSQVVTLIASKYYADNHPSGAVIVITSM